LSAEVHYYSLVWFCTHHGTHGVCYYRPKAVVKNPGKKVNHLHVLLVGLENVHPVERR
jgi:hypothetical protein